MRVLVTGGAGYIGSHTAKKLIQSGHTPVIFDNLSKGHREIAGILGSDAEFIVGDLNRTKGLEAAFTQGSIDAVMHFAAHSLVGESVRNPAKYFYNNVCGGLNLLEAMRRHGVEMIVFSSTAAVYGEPVNVPITEDHPKEPGNPYGESKLFFERILQRYESAYGIRSISLRYFNAAGADPDGELGEDHDPESHLVPIVLQVALGQRSHVEVYGTDYDTRDGTCIRDYIHVTDLSTAHLLALDALAGGAGSTAYNLGSGTGFSVLEVIRMCEKVVGKPIKAIPGERRPGDPAKLVAASEGIARELGWKPRFNDLETIIATAWNWHKKHPGGYSSQ